MIGGADEGAPPREASSSGSQFESPPSNSSRETERLTRFSRQIRLPEIGLLGQNRLQEAKVTLSGDTGITEWAALYLEAAGIGDISMKNDPRLPFSVAEIQWGPSSSKTTSLFAWCGREESGIALALADARLHARPGQPLLFLRLTGSLLATETLRLIGARKPPRSVHVTY
ncbi:MAG: hypothetical protein D6679_02595 [Candidatus Hydrogenedentota bacterium]|nr:MAG: hypothetical protein D6679_02595 [Candidatus Hydrogenedentota bacterium]